MQFPHPARMCHLLKVGCLFALGFNAALPAPTFAAKPVGIRAIQKEIELVESEIDPLPELLPNPTPWTLGYRATRQNNAHRKITINLKFITPAEIDMIAMVPTTYSPGSKEVVAFGFPERFTIEAVLQDGTRERIVDYSQQDYNASGIEPQLFHLAHPVFATGLHITVFRAAPNPTWWDSKYIVTLSEVLAFSDDWNVALGAKATTSSQGRYGYVWSEDCLTDGFFLFSPVTGTLRDPFDNFYFGGDELTVLFDLEEVQEIDELRLWPVVHSLQHNFPQASGIGFPTQIHFEKLDEPADTKGQTLFKSGEPPLRPGSSPLMLGIAPIQGRYFRLTLKDPIAEFRTKRELRFALGEIEILGNGRVLTRNLPPTVRTGSRKTTPAERQSARRLVDGLSTEGSLIPLRSWIEDLNHRALLERRLEELQQNLRLARLRERERLLFTLVLSAGIIFILVILAWMAKLMAKQRWIKVRNRISCDLHDEIGANVSSLVQTAELIQETVHQPTDMQSKLFDDAIQTARLTSRETRNFINFLESDPESFDVCGQIRELAQRMLPTMDCRCDFGMNARFTRRSPSEQWDLFMFVKEALNNIVKHAEASRVELISRRQNGYVQLLIIDNGIGLPENHLPLKHLEARAKRLNAKLHIENNPTGGTCITLRLK
ncbi:histidine kinase [Pontiellaceae bacterium B12227]|nr:histidine kinase [Pontiellaceae bacterium B12227]